MRITIAAAIQHRTFLVQIGLQHPLQVRSLIRVMLLDTHLVVLVIPEVGRKGAVVKVRWTAFRRICRTESPADIGDQLGHGIDLCFIVVLIIIVEHIVPIVDVAGEILSAATFC